jgi:hypothetical protein
VIGSQTTVTTSPTLLVDADSTHRNIVLHAVGNGIVYLGSSAVTSSTGFYVDKAAGAIPITIPSNEKLYGITASGTQLVTVLTPDL